MNDLVERLRSGEDGLELAAADEIEKMEAALREVMQWVKNWDSPFLEDEEWPETEQRVADALGA